MYTRCVISVIQINIHVNTCISLFQILISSVLFCNSGWKCQISPVFLGAMFIHQLRNSIWSHRPKKANMASDTKHKMPPGWSRKLRSSECWRYPPKPGWKDVVETSLELCFSVKTYNLLVFYIVFLQKMNFDVRISWCFQIRTLQCVYICICIIYIYIHIILINVNDMVHLRPKSSSGIMLLLCVSNNEAWWFEQEKDSWPFQLFTESKALEAQLFKDFQTSRHLGLLQK